MSNLTYAPSVYRINFFLLFIGMGLFIFPAFSSNEAHAAPKLGRLTFQAAFGNQPVSCARTISPVGTSDNTVRINDLRFYIHDVALLTKDGRAVLVKPGPSGLWQRDGIALIDLIDRNIPCSDTTPSPNSAISFVWPQGHFTGLRFTVGLPMAANHGDPTIAQPPLNMTSMFWTWQSGYRFFTLDITMIPKPGDKARPHGFPVHIGSTGCESASAVEAPKGACTAPNLVRVTLPEFDPAHQTVKLDISRLLALSNVSTNQINSAPGCMSGPDDKDCAGVFREFGLPFGSETSPPAQSVFRGR